MEKRIEAAIEALPLKANADRRFAIREILHAINLARFLDRPKLKPIGQKAIKTQQDELARLSNALSDHIANMHSHALFPVERKIRYINSTGFHEELRSIADAAKQIDRKGPSRRGPKFNYAAPHVAAVACAVYEQCTGRRATITNDPNTNERRGNFVQFVSDIFKAAEIKANAANYAEQAANIRLKAFGKIAVR